VRKFLQDVGLDEVEHILVESTAKAANLQKRIERVGQSVIYCWKIYNFPILLKIHRREPKEEL